MGSAHMHVASQAGRGGRTQPRRRRRERRRGSWGPCCAGAGWVGGGASCAGAGRGNPVAQVRAGSGTQLPKRGCRILFLWVALRFSAVHSRAGVGPEAGLRSVVPRASQGGTSPDSRGFLGRFPHGAAELTVVPGRGQPHSLDRPVQFPPSLHVYILFFSFSFFRTMHDGNAATSEQAGS